MASISNGYMPRPSQKEIHSKRRRFSVFCIHRRYGKTVLAVNEGIKSAVTCKKHNPHVGIIAPFLKQSKKVAWAYLKDYTYNIPGVQVYEGELKVTIPLTDFEGRPNTATIALYGADNPNSMRGLYWDDCILDEFSQISPALFEQIIRPALADRKGGCVFLGTPSGKDHFYQMYQKAMQRYEEGNSEWFACTLRGDETGHIDPIELEKLKEEMTDDDYKQEILCDWAAGVRGAYYSTEMATARSTGRVANCPYEPRLRTYVAMDLGIHDLTTAWYVQFFGNEIRVLQYEAWDGVGLVDVMTEIKRSPLNVIGALMPWDIEMRELTTGQQRKDMVESLGFEVIVAPKPSVLEGINLTRNLLARCWFNEATCIEGLDCLDAYRRKYNTKDGLWMNAPEHDIYSHGADGFRTLALCYDPDLGDKTFNYDYYGSDSKPKVVRAAT